jgi:hypothetical protein
MPTLSPKLAHRVCMKLRRARQLARCHGPERLTAKQHDKECERQREKLEAAFQITRFAKSGEVP